HIVLDLEDSLSSADKRKEEVALVVVEARLVESPIEVGKQLLDLADVVLQGGREAVAVREVGQVDVVAELVLRRELEACGVRVAVDVVELDPVEAFLRAQGYPGLHYRSEDRYLSDVEPLFPGPAVALTEHGGREAASVWTPVLPGARVDIADDSRPLGVEGRDRGGGVV